MVSKVIEMNGSRIRMVFDAGRWINVEVTPLR